MIPYIFLKDNSGCFMNNILRVRVKVAWNRIREMDRHEIYFRSRINRV